ncbi:MAG TPA: triple tyrosine motif-containing protein, partial [Balneolales bacterium]|nr:triple tyrosine motif-containing protein [Balneolales bacterium]
PGSSLRTLIIDHKGRVWLGFWGAGLYMFDGSSFKHFGNQDGLTSRMIRDLFEDRSGNIWIATRDKGLFRYDGKSFRNFSKQNVLESNWIRSITQDSRGRMWFGTAHGLSLYDGRTWRSYHSLPGLLIDDVNYVYSASADTILFCTSSSLFLFRYPGGNREQNLSTIYIKNVTQGNRQIGTLPVLPDVTHFADIYRFLRSPVSHLAITPLPYSRNELSIEIAGVQFQKSSDVHYTYKLVGLDSSWTSPSRQTLVNYRNLPPGTYTFLAKTVVNGIWSPLPASLSFTILTPYWKKFWFIGLMIFSGILLIVTITSLVNRYRYKQLLRLARLRSDIASDLHDDIGSALSSISIYSELARREAKNDPEHAAHFSERVENISRNLMDAMNDIIWSINPGNETLADVILRMEEFVVGLLEAKGIEVYLTTPDTIPDITFDLHARHNLLLIFKEITNNTARHSGATKAEIKIEVMGANSPQKKSPYTLYIIFSDNGRGFDTMQESGGNGLHNIKKRSEDIGGKLVVTSQVGKGTRTELSVPLKS